MTPTILPISKPAACDEPIVVSGLGMITALGRDRETSWRGMRAGKCGIGWVRSVPGLPDDEWFGAQVDLPSEGDDSELKAIRLARIAAGDRHEVGDDEAERHQHHEPNCDHAAPRPRPSAASRSMVA